MLCASVCLRCAPKDVTKCSSSTPILSPAVTRSLYRALYREVYRLDADPLAKTLFPLTKDLQEIAGTRSPLYVPNGKKYVDVLRAVFRDPGLAPRPSLAFEALNRLRAHSHNVSAQLPSSSKDRTNLMNSLKLHGDKQKDLYRVEPMPIDPSRGVRFVPASANVPTRIALRDTSAAEITEGTVLAAHPLSSTHVDRRVMLITERTPHVTSAVVLDLQFTYPLSRGNPMFPEVFWGHEVYDGGFSQIGFTMPPTAQITILHTLEPPEDQPESPQYRNWLKWLETSREKVTSARRHHELLCKPLISGGVLPNGDKEPTLYLSKVEALPYLSHLVQGQPRSCLRVYWGNMRWTTAQVEAEVGNGHWIPLKVSPRFFAPYSLAPEGTFKDDHFLNTEELSEAKVMRERRYGADISLPQVFPPDQILRRRECLWDEIMFGLGGEYVALVGCTNPFSTNSRTAVPQILAPLVGSSDGMLEDMSGEDEDDLSVADDVFEIHEEHMEAFGGHDLHTSTPEEPQEPAPSSAGDACCTEKSSPNDKNKPSEV